MSTPHLVRSTQTSITRANAMQDIQVRVFASLSVEQFHHAFTFVGDGLSCVPSCTSESCDPVHGICVAPNTCSCRDNYYGSSCALMCACNNHTTFARIELSRSFLTLMNFSTCTATVCGTCLNHTTGPHCDQCEFGFFGNASRGTPNDCATCNITCNGHTQYCYSSFAAAAGNGALFALS